MPWRIVPSGGQFLVVGGRSGKVRGKHPTRAAAVRQLRALYANVPEARSKKEHSGVMVAFFTPQLGDTEKHVTLLYLGDAGQMGQNERILIQRTLEQFSKNHYALDAALGGIGEFKPTDENGGKCPVVALVDSAGLPAFRQELLEALQKSGIRLPQTHGFTPHVTLDYILPDKDTLSSYRDQIKNAPRLILDELVLCWGDERAVYPLQRVPSQLDAKEVSSTPTAIPAHGPGGLLSSPGLGEKPPRRRRWGKKQRRKEITATLTAFKDARGDYRWVLYSSNAYRDRDGEIVSTKALQADVENSTPGNYGPLRWWHTEGADLGQCDFRMLHGRVLIESGTFYIPRVGAKIAEKAAGLQASIGFRHPPTEPDSHGVFHNIRVFERSLVPAGRAANPHTRLIVQEKGAQ